MTVCLQRDDITLSEVRALFDTVLEKYPSTAFRISPSSPIVESPNFESGMVNVQRKRVGDGAENEMAAMECFRDAISDAPAEVEMSLSLA